MIKRGLLAVAGLLMAAPLAAHDYWLQPTQFWPASGKRVALALWVGHGPDRQLSDLPVQRITRLKSAGPTGETDRKSELPATGNLSSVVMSLGAGTNVISFSTTNARSDLPAVRFNDYAATEGLTPILRHRMRTGTTDAPGRELYSRRAKSLVQVGMPGRQQPQVTKPVGLELELVPLRNPYEASKDAALPVQVLYQGKPLPGALVKLTDLNADAKPAEAHLSNAQGISSFKTRRSGNWQLNVVWSQPLTPSGDTIFLTTFSSLTFGFPSRPTRS